MCDTALVGATESRPVLIGQLTDTHVLAVDDTETEAFVDNNARLADALASIGRETPALDAVVMTGDLTDDGRPEQYDALVDLLAVADVPLLVLPGNHDDPDSLRDRFPATPWADEPHASWVAEVGGVRIVGLDSTRAGHHGGQIDERRARWLRDVLSEPHSGATLLAMHHPPFLTGVHWMDEGGIDGVERLADVLVDRPVDRVICGHLHRSVVGSIGGVACQIGMSTVQHVHLDLGERATVAVVDDPVGYQIHRVDGRDVVTHARFIRSGSPIVPAWAADYA